MVWDAIFSNFNDSLFRAQRHKKHFEGILKLRNEFQAVGGFPTIGVAKEKLYCVVIFESGSGRV